MTRLLTSPKHHQTSYWPSLRFCRPHTGSVPIGFFPQILETIKVPAFSHCPLRDLNEIFSNYPASREMLDRRWANVVTYVGATSANDVGPMWICPSVTRWHNVVTPPTMTLCQRFANVITYCILLYFMVIGTTFAQCLYEWLAKHWHNFMKQWCPLYVFLYSYPLSPIACRRLRLR